MNSGAWICPLYGNECGWLVVLFFITLLMNVRSAF